jgi:PhzF family phenazine biosynthesis protein
MTNHVTLYQVDAFTPEPFKGNPAGVCILEKEMPGGWMQNIALEMNLSETAFISPGDGFWKIRYFTPAAEIPLCGHATLGSAHLMFEAGIVEKDSEIVFSSKAGRLAVRCSNQWIVMNFPAYESHPVAVPSEAEALLGIRPSELYMTDHGWALVILDSEADLRNLKPDFKAMKDSEFGDLIASAPSSGQGFDYCVRCFAPALGIDEDPVTGSAQSALVPFWNRKTGKKSFITHQVSKRGGVLKATLINNRVEIEGQARTVFRIELLI